MTTAVSAALRRERIVALAVGSNSSSDEGNDNGRHAERRAPRSGSAGGKSPPATADRSPDDMRRALEHFRSRATRSLRSRMAAAAAEHKSVSPGGVGAAPVASPSPLRNDGDAELQNLLPTPMRDNRARCHSDGVAVVDEAAQLVSLPAAASCRGAPASDVATTTSAGRKPLPSRNAPASGAVPQRSITVPVRKASPAVRSTGPPSRRTSGGVSTAAANTGKVVPKGSGTGGSSSFAGVVAKSISSCHAKKPIAGVGRQRTSSASNTRGGDSRIAAETDTKRPTAASSAIATSKGVTGIRKAPNEGMTPHGRSGPHQTSHGMTTAAALLLAADPSPPPRSPRAFYTTPSGPSTVSNQSIAFRVEPSEAPRLQSTKFYLDDGTLLLSPDGPLHAALPYLPTVRVAADGGESLSSVQPPEPPCDSDSEYQFVDCGSPPPPPTPPSSSAAAAVSAGSASVQLRPLQLEQIVVPKLPVSAATRTLSAAVLSSNSSSRTLPRTARDNQPMLPSSSRSARSQVSSTSAARRAATPPTTRSGNSAATRRTLTTPLEPSDKRVGGGGSPTLAGAAVAAVMSPRSWASTPRTARGAGFREVARPTPAYVHPTDLESAEQERRGEVKGRESATVAIIFSHARRERQELLLVHMARNAEEEAHRRGLIVRRYLVVLFEEVIVPSWIEGTLTRYRNLLDEEYRLLCAAVRSGWALAAEGTIVKIREGQATERTAICSCCIFAAWAYRCEFILSQEVREARAIASMARWTETSRALYDLHASAMTQTMETTVGQLHRCAVHVEPLRLVADGEVACTTERRCLADRGPTAAVEPTPVQGSCADEADEESECSAAQQVRRPSDPDESAVFAPRTMQLAEILAGDDFERGKEESRSSRMCGEPLRRAVGQPAVAVGPPSDTTEFVVLQERQKRARLSDAFSKQRAFMEECFAAEYHGLASQKCTLALRYERPLMTARPERDTQHESKDSAVRFQRCAPVFSPVEIPAPASTVARRGSSTAAAPTDTTTTAVVDKPDSRQDGTVAQSASSTELDQDPTHQPLHGADRRGGANPNDHPSCAPSSRTPAMSRLERKVVRERRHLTQLMELFLSRLRSQCSEEAVKMALSPRRTAQGPIVRSARDDSEGAVGSTSDDDRDQRDVEEDNEFATIVLE